MSPRRDPDEDLLKDDDDDDEILGDVPHASASRWRHEESSAYHRAAGQHAPTARDAASHGGRVNELADFLNSSRISPEEARREAGVAGTAAALPKSKPVVAKKHNGDEKTAAADGEYAADGREPIAGPDGAEARKDHDGKEIVCGPLLNYRRTENGTWIGSVLVVTKGGGKTQEFMPTLELSRVATRSQEEEGAANGASTSMTSVQGICLYSDPRNTFWRFDLAAPLEATETEWAYTLPEMRFLSKTKPTRNHFFVPAADESMRIMFYSCNGFSVGTDEAAWSGLALWNDVMRRHRDAPFHVMLGGGDQIYNDGIRVAGPLRAWTDIGNPKKRRDWPFPEKMRRDCDNYYRRNYIRWYSTEPFASANGQIPALNIWDDHDIIDGFGSYVKEFNQCDVFRGIGGTAHKYYLLFQHHLPPPMSTYTTDSVQTTTSEGQGVDPNQLVDTYVAPPMEESNYIVGTKPGPYVAERSLNILTSLGARIAFLGIDARTERTRHQVNYPETYDQIFARLRQELAAAAEAGKPIKHLILLLGIPIAYPRLTWLENIFNSPLIGPIKFMNRRFGFGGGVFNHFDGSLDLLDDLDDHYTARTHKKERKGLLMRLQAVCADFSVRTTILSGDVHLAGLGRFFTVPGVPVGSDSRYMVNVVSSAIVNKPPPQAIANFLARRNKVHHLDDHTDETLMHLFDRAPGDEPKSAAFNRVTMPARNFAMLTENSPNNPAPPTPTSPVRVDPDAPPVPSQMNVVPPTSAATNGAGRPISSSGMASVKSSRSKLLRRNGRPTSSHDANHKHGHGFLGPGEQGAGSRHKAASGTAHHGRGNDGGLDVCICVEMDQHDAEGHTRAYGLTIPILQYEGPVSPPRPGSIAA